jgi:hypothetical protein
MTEAKDIIALFHGGFPDGKNGHKTEYSGLSCICGYNLYIKTPQKIDLYSFKCPICNYIQNTLCGKK